MIEHLRKLADRFGLSISKEQGGRFERHFELMVQWNKTHNLTRIVDPRAAAERHYLDCIWGLSFLPSKVAILDAGSGAGFPGLMAAIVWPERRIRLVEPSRKRASFLKVACVELGLRQVVVENKRVEEVAPEAVVISRATFSWPGLRPVFEAVGEGGALGLFVGDSLSEDDLISTAEDVGFSSVEVKNYGGDLYDHRILLARGKRVKT
jgi:16S rRNA (guanine(527)-N(7))-methyltransferase RsmG